MCLLTVAGPGVVQRAGELILACANNPDGFGYAVHAGDRIITKRSMVASEIIDRYLSTRERFPNGPAIFHARFATHGDEHLDNCHPFRVGGDERIVLAPNGVLPLAAAKGDHRSDTRIYATEVLSRIGVTALDDPSWTAATEQWLGANKVAIVSVHPTLAEPLYLLNARCGTWVDGIWWSNETYRTEPYFEGWRGTLPLDDEEACEVCNHLLSEVSLIEDVCQHCGACLWCGDPIEECRCYPSTRSSSSSGYVAWSDEQGDVTGSDAFESDGFEDAGEVAGV